jgi:hypothetical protein
MNGYLSSFSGFVSVLPEKGPYVRNVRKLFLCDYYDMTFRTSLLNIYTYQLIEASNISLKYIQMASWVFLVLYIALH